jgi:hypothetical protein
MNQYPESQQPFEQQGNQLLHCQSAIAKPDQLVCTTESITSSLIPQFEPATLVKYGGVTVAVILSIAILILTLAEYNKIFVLVMLQKPEEKNE